MKICIIGATGRTGKEIVNQALEAGHTVTVYVREPSRLVAPPSRLFVFKGPILDTPSLKTAVKNQDVIIMAIGLSTLGRSTIRTEGAKSLVRAMIEENPQAHLIVMSSLGAGDSRAQIPALVRPFLMFTLRNVLKDHDGQEEVIENSGLENWTIVRPTGLSDAPPHPHPGNPPYEARTEGKIHSWKISRADVAEFILLEAQTRQFHGQKVAIG